MYAQTYTVGCSILTGGRWLHIWRIHRHIRYTTKTTQWIRRYTAEACLVVNVNSWPVLIPEIYVALFQKKKQNAQLQYDNASYRWLSPSGGIVIGRVCWFVRPWRLLWFLVSEKVKVLLFVKFCICAKIHYHNFQRSRTNFKVKTAVIKSSTYSSVAV